MSISRSYFSGRLTRRAAPRNASAGGSSGCAASMTPASSATGHDLAQKDAEALPQLCSLDLDRRGAGAAGAIAHVPDHAVRQRQVGIDRREVEPHRHRVTARVWPARPAPDAGDGKVVADARDAGAPGVAHQALQALDLAGAVGPAQQHIRPEARRQILDAGEFQARCRAPISPARRNRHRSTIRRSSSRPSHRSRVPAESEGSRPRK